MLFHVKNCFQDVNFDSEVYLLRQIELYIDSAPFRRVKRTGSLGLSKNTVRNLKQFCELVEAFERDANWRIDVTELDHVKTEQFRTWLLQTKGYSLNNAGLQFKLLKMICREAEKRGVAVHHYTRHIESFNLMPKDRYIHTLSFEEIDRIRSLAGLPSNIENSRKWMLIGLHIGQRVSDLLSLQPSQIRPCTHGLYLDIIQKKTEKFVTVGVVDQQVIHILQNDFPYQISPQQFNMHLKEICRRVGINEKVKGYKLCTNSRRKILGTFPKYQLISSHDLRRSFATNYFGKIETPILMQITGHSKESTFLKYIGYATNKDTYADAFMKVAANL